MSASAPEQQGSPGLPPADRHAGRTLLDELRVGIVMLDSRGRIILWSPMTEEILGWPDRLAVGRHLADFLPVRSEVTPGTGVYRTLLRESSWRGVLPLRHLDGHTIELDGRATLLRDADGTRFILANLVEMDRLRTIEQDLAALDALFSSSPLGLAIYDTDGRFVRVNDSFCQLYGGRPDMLLGRRIREVMPDHLARELDELHREVLTSGRSVIDLVTLSPDGKGAHSLSFGRLSDGSGQTLGISCTVMDITERREALEKIERARQRLALLDDVGIALGERLDVRRIAEALANALVPRFADYATVLLLAGVAQGGDLPEASGPAGASLLQLGVAAKQHNATVDRMMQLNQDITFDTESVFGRVLATGAPHLVRSRNELLGTTYAGDPKTQAALDLGIHSLMTLPIRARGTVLGLLVISRADRRAAFEHEDLVLAGEIAARAGVSLDNGRLYVREREGALMLQRSLLPQHVPSLPGVQIAFRYVPGSSGTEVGGDWFDVIPLTGGRVAMVVGDVMGHGLRAAATMGRLRTAVRTLAGLDLPPAELLHRVNELSDDLSPGPQEPLMATCVYAVYDPATSSCTVAKAGHVPPVLATRDARTGLWRAGLLEVPAGPPLGVGDLTFEERHCTVPEGSVLVLYTDGLIEKRDEDITEGLDRLCAALGRTKGPHPSLEDVCDHIIQSLGPGTAPAGRGLTDDIALLTAQLGGIPDGGAASWTFPAESSAPGRARTVVRRTLLLWGLEEVTDLTVLLVSELVTNSLRHAHGPIGVRLVRGESLLLEVSDPLPDPPRERPADPEAESGRGLHLLARESRRWGTRRGPLGKTVWCELPLPGTQEP